MTQQVVLFNRAQILRAFATLKTTTSLYPNVNWGATNGDNTVYCVGECDQINYAEG